MPPIGTIGIMLPNEDYLLKSLNVRQDFFLLDANKNGIKGRSHFILGEQEKGTYLEEPLLRYHRMIKLGIFECSKLLSAFYINVNRCCIS